MKSNDKIIEFKNITKSFGDKCFLDDISFYVNKGEFLTLLGPSGCGKTTLLRLLAGFGNTDKGEILINGENIRPQYWHVNESRLNTSNLKALLIGFRFAISTYALSIIVFYRLLSYYTR